MSQFVANFGIILFVLCQDHWLRSIFLKKKEIPSHEAYILFISKDKSNETQTCQVQLCGWGVNPIRPGLFSCLPCSGVGGGWVGGGLAGCQKSRLPSTNWNQI